MSLKVVARTLSPNRKLLKSLSPDRGVLRTLSPNREQFKSLSPDQGLLRTLIPHRKPFRSLSQNRELLGTLSPNQKQYRSLSSDRGRLTTLSPHRKQFRSLSQNKELMKSLSPDRGLLRSLSPDRGFATSKQQVRTYSSRNDCGPDPAPRCSREKMTKMRCDMEALREKIASNEFDAACCNNPCLEIDPMPRFDDLYYRPSDKSKRKFAQTWFECPEIKIQPRKKCTYEIEEPYFDRRPPKRAPKVKCPPVSKYAKELLLGSTLVKGKCPHMRLKCCRLPRHPPECNKDRKPSDCTKWEAPYPSYSECLRDCPKPPKIKECKCWDFRPYCPEYSFKPPMKFVCP